MFAAMTFALIADKTARHARVPRAVAQRLLVLSACLVDLTLLEFLGALVARRHADIAVFRPRVLQTGLVVPLARQALVTVGTFGEILVPRTGNEKKGEDEWFLHGQGPPQAISHSSQTMTSAAQAAFAHMQAS